jgi:hypothetical protein
MEIQDHFLDIFNINFNMIKFKNIDEVLTYVGVRIALCTSSLHSQTLVHVFGITSWTSCRPSPMPFIWWNITFAHFLYQQIIKASTFNIVCLSTHRCFFIPSFPCSRNLQPCWVSHLYNIYVDRAKPSTLYEVFSQTLTPHFFYTNCI